MSQQDYSHILQTTKNGRLDTINTRQHVQDLVGRALASGKPLVLHLHGGLVPAETAYKTVNELQPLYLQAGLFPIFIVWRTGLFDALKNADEIVKRPLFKKLQERLLKFLVSRYGGISGKSLDGGPEPDSAEILAELKKRDVQEVPFVDVHPKPETDGLTEAEEDALKADVEMDERLLIEWDKEVKAALETPPSEAAAPLANAEAAIPSPKLDQDIVEEAQATSSETKSLSILSAALLAKHVVSIGTRVISRFYHHRDHGFHATIVEEILRKLYIDSLGTEVWQMMKTDSEDTFKDQDNTPERGGWLLMRLVANALVEAKKNGKPTTSISIVGHSAGSIFACHLIEYLHNERLSSSSAWSSLDHPVDKLVFLAPAVTHRVFAKMLEAHGKTLPFRNFRMFSLSDADERGYYEIPVLYPGSLLYIISGLLENVDDEGSADMPLVGMERYGRDQHAYEAPEVKTVWNFLKAEPGRLVWSGHTGGVGLTCDAKKHGSFDQGPSETMASVLHFLTTH